MSTSTEIKTTYTPWSVVNLYNNGMRVKEETILITVKGVYLPGPPKDYAGFFYDSLKEEASQAALSMKISAMDRSRLKPHGVVEVKGFISRKVEDKGIIKLLLNVTEVIGQAAAAFSSADVKALELVQAKAQNGYRDVEGFLMKFLAEGRKPVIKIIVGTTAIIDQDIKVGFGESLAFYNPEFIKVNLSDPDTIVNVMSQTVCDILLIARGGGSGLDVFNVVGVAEAALKCKPILISAIGHASDHVLLERLCDRYFITPTESGNFFREVYNRSAQQITGSQAKLIDEATRMAKKDVEQKLLLQDKLLAEKDKQLKLGRVILYILGALLAGAVLTLLFMK